MTRVLVEITSDAPGTETAVRRALGELARELSAGIVPADGDQVLITADADDDGTMRTIYTNESTV